MSLDHIPETMEDEMTDQSQRQVDDTEARRRVHDEYVARETVLHETMNHPLEVDPFDEYDVEGHMPTCKRCI